MAFSFCIADAILGLIREDVTLSEVYRAVPGRGLVAPFTVSAVRWE